MDSLNYVENLDFKFLKIVKQPTTSSKSKITLLIETTKP
jgi:hypothetical protein